jgi:hypothetical protein
VRATIRHRATAKVVVASALMLLAACGGSEASEDEGAATPSCMASLTPSSVPEDGSFPTDWPFPPGTVVTGIEEVPGGGLAVTAQVGSEFDEVLPFMQEDVEDAGFVATQGEAESHDAEAVWTGGGYAGSWAIRSSPDCDGTTLLQVAAAKQ